MVKIVVTIKKEFLHSMDEVITHLTYHGMSIEQMTFNRLYGEAPENKINSIGNLEEVDLVEKIDRYKI